MTKNPFLNALAGTAYIALVSSVMYFGTQHLGPGPDNTVLAPIVFLSLFSLSAATMGYIFMYQPIIIFLDGKKKEAVDLFLKTVAVFAGITVTILAIFFSGIFR